MAVKTASEPCIAFCTACGMENQAAKFCRGCGAVIKASARQPGVASEQKEPEREAQIAGPPEVQASPARSKLPPEARVSPPAAAAVRPASASGRSFWLGLTISLGAGGALAAFAAGTAMVVLKVPPPDRVTLPWASSKTVALPSPPDHLSAVDANAPTPRPAVAKASFDCRSASGWSESEVCQNRALAVRDAELGRLYRARLARAAPEEREQLQAAQRAWIQSRETCRASDRPDECLVRQYRQRIAELQKPALVKVGAPVVAPLVVAPSAPRSAEVQAYAENEANRCLAAQNLDCAESNAKIVLQISPNDPSALNIISQIKSDRLKAFSGNWNAH